jgi:fumarate reductase flavoprotein subunit
MSVTETGWDVIVVGGGSSGLPAAIFSARRGARVLLVDVASKLGGTLWVASGQMSAAGTRLQREKGIGDSPDSHYDDIMRINRHTANAALVRMAVDHAADTFDWLMDSGFEPLPDHPILGWGHEPYREKRYYWGADGGISVKNILVPMVEELEKSGAITVKLEHRVTALELDDDGRVVGVTARDAEGRTHKFLGASTVLTTGGYASNAGKFEELSGLTQYHALPYEHSQGDGLDLGLAVGGWLRGHENVYCNFGTLFDTDQFPAQMTARPETFPERRQPWEIYVNAHGQRFVKEDVPSVDAREFALLQQPDRRYWIVFDQAIFDASPPLLIDWTRQDMIAAFDRNGPAFSKADTVEELAAEIGVDARKLCDTVEAFNYGVETGHDLFGRDHAPRKIEQGPFYAIRMQGCSITGAVGLAVDDDLRVIRKDGSPIGGLYAAGEMLGSSQTMGKAACGGMMVTPALTFGRLLGQSILPIGA